MASKAIPFMGLLLVLSACPAEETTASSDTETSGGAGSDTETSPETSTGTGTSDPEPETDTGESGETDDPSADGSDSGGAASLTFEEYAEARNELGCEAQVACGFLPSAAECTTTVQDDSRENVAIESGELVFDGVAAAACIAVMAEQEPHCTTAFAELTPQQAQESMQREAACADVLTGAIPVGEACNIFNGCAGTNTLCEGLQSAGCIAGTCTEAPEPAAAGASCDIHAFGAPQCNEDLYCAPVDPGDFDSDGTCEPLAELGGECHSAEGCANGLLCASGEEPTDPGTCVPVGGSGEACTPQDLNAANLCAASTDHCDPDSQTCAPRRDIGETCDGTSECVQYGHCPNGTCTLRAGDGESCAPGGDGCMGFLHCDFDTSTCTRFEFPICK